MKNYRALPIFFLLIINCTFSLSALPTQNILVRECDQIVLVKGEAIEVKILKVKQFEIIYRRCDNIEGPVYTLDLKEVKKIRYSNGTEKDIDFLIIEQESIRKKLILKIFGALLLSSIFLFCLNLFFGWIRY